MENELLTVYRSILRSILEIADDSVENNRPFPVNRVKIGIVSGLSPDEVKKIGPVIWRRQGGKT